jgi:hypothetical protein
MLVNFADILKALTVMDTGPAGRSLTVTFSTVLRRSTCPLPRSSTAPSPAG